MLVTDLKREGVAVRSDPFNKTQLQYQQQITKPPDAKYRVVDAHLRDVNKRDIYMT